MKESNYIFSARELIKMKKDLTVSELRQNVRDLIGEYSGEEISRQMAQNVGKTSINVKLDRYGNCNGFQLRKYRDVDDNFVRYDGSVYIRHNTDDDFIRLSNDNGRFYYGRNSSYEDGYDLFIQGDEYSSLLPLFEDMEYNMKQVQECFFNIAEQKDFIKRMNSDIISELNCADMNKYRSTDIIEDVLQDIEKRKNDAHKYLDSLKGKYIIVKWKGIKYLNIYIIKMEDYKLSGYNGLLIKGDCINLVDMDKVHISKEELNLYSTLDYDIYIINDDNMLDNAIDELKKSFNKAYMTMKERINL